MSNNQNNPQEMKDKLKSAYEAGVRSVELNKKRDELLERGTKQCPAEYNFDNWFNNQDAEKSVTTYNDYFKLSEKIANEYSELKRLFKSNIGSDQISHAFEKFHDEALKLEGNG